MKRYLIALLLTLTLPLLTGCFIQVAGPTSSQSTSETTADATGKPATQEPNSEPASQPQAAPTDAAPTTSEYVPVIIDDYELTRLDGTTVRLSEVSKPVTVINFWASWCQFCVREMPDMDRIAKLEDVSVIMLNSGEDSATIEAFLKDKGYSFDVYLDKDNLIAGQFGVGGLPTSVFVGENRELYYIQPGLIDYDLFTQIKEAIEKFVASRKTP